MKEDAILRNCDDKSIMSLNGRRATDAIIDYISINNDSLYKFQITLRCIKLWAKNRGIYSNVLGYCGGVAYAILVAYICKHNPDLEVCQLIDTFFRFYRMRQWGTDHPIHLNAIIQAESSKIPILEDQKSRLIYQKKERADFFPIITPAEPQMNSTGKVTLTTRNIIITELEKGMEITKHMMKKNNNQITWRRLFKKFPFFKAYKHFI